MPYFCVFAESFRSNTQVAKNGFDFLHLCPPCENMCVRALGYIVGASPPLCVCSIGNTVGASPPRMCPFFAGSLHAAYSALRHFF